MKIKIILYISSWILLGMSSITTFALTVEDRMLLEKYDLSGPKILMHTDKWVVKPSKIDIDGQPFKGQGRSIIDWKMDHRLWLDFNYWKEQRAERDKFPRWKIKLREIKHTELIGKVIKCIGVCQIFRGKSDVNARYMSRIYEGDELMTAKDSSIWVSLMDGAIFRLSPKSSITFNEINVGSQDYMYYLRLNQGHIHWQTRKIGKFKEQNLAETDLGFYPLMLKEANRDHFSRLEYQMMDHDERLLYHTRKNPGHDSQYEQLNKLINEDKEQAQNKNSTIFMVTANSSYLVRNSHFDLYYDINGKANFRFKEQLDGFINQDKRKSSARVYFRGYLNRKRKNLQVNQWYEMDRKGKVFVPKDLDQRYKVIDLFVKRTPSIHMARELFIREDFNHVLEDDLTAEDWAVAYGYRLWDEGESYEFRERFTFLKEYTRRVETTNITSLSKVFKSKKPQPFDSSFYHKALSLHLKKLKGLYAKHRSVLPELNELQYYIWILKYAKND